VLFYRNYRKLIADVVPSSGTGVCASLVSAAAAVQERRDAGQQTEEHQLSRHPHAVARCDELGYE